MPRAEISLTHAEMNVTRAKPKKPLNTPRANLNRDPCNSLSTVRVELSTPRATPKISAHASRTRPVLKTRASQTTDTVRAKTRAEPLTLLHSPCSCPMCGRNNAHVSLARSVLMTRTAPFLLVLGALHTHGRRSSPRTPM